MKIGAYDYLTKPYSINELDVRVRQAAEKRNLRVDNQRLRAQIERKSAAARNHQPIAGDDRSNSSG